MVGTTVSHTQSRSPTQIALPVSFAGYARYSAGFARYVYPDVLSESDSFVYFSRSNLLTAALTDDAEKALNVHGYSPIYLVRTISCSLMMGVYIWSPDGVSFRSRYMAVKNVL